jgi:hypothetical protein
VRGQVGTGAVATEDEQDVVERIALGRGRGRDHDGVDAAHGRARAGVHDVSVARSVVTERLL